MSKKNASKAKRELRTTRQRRANRTGRKFHNAAYFDAPRLFVVRF